MSILSELMPGVGDVMGKAFDRLFPDPEVRRKAELEVLRMNMEGEFKYQDFLSKSDANQADINKIDAASGNFFQYGWRSAAGWVCVLGLLANFLVVPALGYLLGNLYGWAPPARLDTQELLGLLFALLGLGGYRSFEILRGRKIAG